MDLELARQSLEGVAQGFDRFPDATLTGVYSYGGSGAAQTKAGPEIARLHSDASAVTEGYGSVIGGDFVMQSRIYFNTRFSAAPDVYRAGRKAGHEDGTLATDSPTGTALHEFGHVMSNQTGTRRAAYDTAVDLADAAGAAPRPFITKSVSGYASSDMGEFSAEAFADVMANGSAASATSKAAFDVIESAYNKGSQ